MVKYWSDKVKFWIYTAFKAFQISHQLLLTVAVYTSNRRMPVWVKKEDALTVVPVPDSLIIHISQFCNCPNRWQNEEYYNPPTSKALVLFCNQFKRSKWAPVFILNLKYWYLSKTIPFLKHPLIPTFLLLIKARRCDQSKSGNVFSQGTICLGVFCATFLHSYPYLTPISRKKTEDHM